ncbi:MAG: hypothetical protein Fur0037_08580 [Planctomycetota bacterium]
MARALDLLEVFTRRILPGFLRRQAQWKRLPPGSQSDLVEDLKAALAVDCLERAAEICDLEPRERHGRWFRLLEREVRSSRPCMTHRANPAAEPDEIAVDPGPLPFEIEELMRAVPEPFEGLLAGAPPRGKQRGLSGTTARLKIGRLRVRRLWVDLAERLGFDDGFLSFWRNRLAEATLGLAADLLRRSEQLCLLRPARYAPCDPQGRRRRLYRIRNHVRLRPLPSEFMRLMAAARRIGRRASSVEDAHSLLVVTRRLSPRKPAVLLWCFEAEILRGDLRSAARCLRLAQQLGGEDVRVLLARSRLLEARGRVRAARALLSRGARRYPADSRPEEALRRFDDGRMIEADPRSRTLFGRKSRDERIAEAPFGGPVSVDRKPHRFAQRGRVEELPLDEDAQLAVVAAEDRGPAPRDHLPLLEGPPPAANPERSLVRGLERAEGSPDDFARGGEAATRNAVPQRHDEGAIGERAARHRGEEQRERRACGKEPPRHFRIPLLPESPR